jgi:hypothetical protein
MMPHHDLTSPVEILKDPDGKPKSWLYRTTMISILCDIFWVQRLDRSTLPVAMCRYPRTNDQPCSTLEIWCDRKTLLADGGWIATALEERFDVDLSGADRDAVYDLLNT